MVTQQSLIPIGILTLSDGVRLFKGNRERFMEWSMAGAKRGFQVWVIPHLNIQPPLAHVRAYHYQEATQQWLPQQIVLPSIVYNRISNRKEEQSYEVQSKINYLVEQRNVTLFNPSFFNKWSTLKWMQQSKKLKKTIPTSWQLTRHLPLVALIKKHKCLFLKPEQGRAGNGICVIRYHPQQGYSIQKQLPLEAVQSILYHQSKQWQKAIWQHVENNAFLVQKAVQVAKVQGRAFDLRTLLQKNKHGQWAITGIGARIAGATSITTHVPHGGSIGHPTTTLTSAIGALKMKRVLRQVRRYAIAVAKQIEHQSGHMLFELSLDIGIDVQGKHWLFEANAKPMIFDEPLIHRRSIKRLFDFCHYLANRQLN